MSYPFSVHTLPDWSLLAVCGPQALSFLNGQLSADLRILPQDSTQHLLSAYCTPAGRIRAIVRVFYRDPEYLILRVPSDLILKLQILLQQYGAFSDISVEILSGWSGIGLSAPFLISSQANPCALTADQPILCCTVPSCAEQSRYELYAPTAILEDFLHTKSLWTDRRSEGPAFWQYAEIQAKIPDIRAHNTELFLPQDLELERFGALSMDKGCYCGQEIITRMHFKSKRKKGTAIRPMISGAPSPALSAGEVLIQDVVEPEPCSLVLCHLSCMPATMA